MRGPRRRDPLAGEQVDRAVGRTDIGCRVGEIEGLAIDDRGPTQCEHAGDVDRLVQLKEGLLGELAGDFERRKAIRPLLDIIDRAKRMHKK
ncbi:hypothetical protein EON64_19600 [archaeon]|nr:MAG: hypothetical protein EON64_19600 [archaeon]